MPISETGIGLENITRSVFRSMPDGSAVDYNRIFDVTDEVLGTNRIGDKAAERFMCQYKDAFRLCDMVLARYEQVAGDLSCLEQRFIRDPSRRMTVAEDYRKEAASVERILAAAEIECDRAKRTVGELICQLKTGKQKLVMAAHYLCMADWFYISKVYGHQNRWAKSVHDDAMKTVREVLDNRSAGTNDAVCERQVLQEINDLIVQWKRDERNAHIEGEEKKYKVTLNDMNMVLSVE